MLIICPEHILTASACVIAYELNFQQRGKWREGEKTGDISAACSRSGEEVQAGGYQNTSAS